MAGELTPEIPVPEAPGPHGPDLVRAGSRGRRLSRVFLMTAGGLAAPCLALAAFFVSNGGGSDTPATSAGVAQRGRVTTTTAPRTLTVPTAAGAPSTTTTTLAPVPLSPSRDPFAPLVARAPAGDAPAR